MEKVVEPYNGKYNKQRCSNAMSLQKPKTTIATSKEQQQAQEYYTQSKIHENYNNTKNKRNEENFEQQQQQKRKSKHRNNQTARQQHQQYAYNAQNATARTTSKTQEQQQQQHQHKQSQLTPTVDYFRFSALYALVATSAAAAAAKYSMRYASADCVNCDNDDDEDEDDGDDNDDGVANEDHSAKAQHKHNTRQRRCISFECANSSHELKRNRTSLTHKQLSKLLRDTCHRSGGCGSGGSSILQTPTGIVDGISAGSQSVTNCGFFSASCGGGIVGTGSGTSCIVGVGLDTRSIFYLTLLLFIYCGVMMRASVAATAIANVTFYNDSNTNTNKTNAPIIVTANLTASSYFTFSSAPIEDATNSSVIIMDKNYNNVQNATTSASTTTSSNSVTPITFNLTFGDASSSQLNVSLVRTMHTTSTALVVNTNESLAEMQSIVKRDTAHVPDDEDDSAYHDDEFDEYEALINNRSAKGKYIGAPCLSDMTCESALVHVTCDKETKICGCEKNYPVQLGLTKGCDKPKKLGEQCFYDETCMYNDENSLCIQVRHNAKCQCAHGFHSVSHTKPTRRIFCTKDLKELNSDLPTLLGVTTGIAVLAGLICMVLHLFSKTKYPRPRNFGDANLPPPIMYSSETGIPLTVQSGRPSSRSSLRSSGSIGSYGNRRASSGGATTAGGRHGMDGISGIVGSGGAGSSGSRRPSLASVHSTSSSVRSYSMMRFEKEAQQKEIRQEMKLRLARLQHQQHLNQNKPQIVIGDTLQHHMGAGSALSRLSGMPTPSPLTPNSTDELLPSVDELQEYPPKCEDLATTIHKMAADSVAASTLTAIKQAALGTSSALTTTMGVATTATSTGASGSGGLITPATPSDNAEAAAYIGPCSSSTEAL